jgi:hypothetical protein
MLYVLTMLYTACDPERSALRDLSFGEMQGAESKHPENVYATHAVSGSSLENSLTQYGTASSVGILRLGLALSRSAGSLSLRSG